MSASSLVFSSLSLPKTLSLPNSATPSLSILPFRSNLRVKPIALSIHSSLASRFTRNVALSSEVDQDEDFAAGDEVEQNFSPDLKLFVGNLPFNVESADLAQLFERAGSVEMVEVIYDKITGRSRGFGFVTMSTTQEVEAAAQQFNGYEFEGRALRVNYGPPPRKEESGFRGGSRSFEGRPSFDRRSDFDSSNRLYVGNLSWAVDNLALENLFSEQGKVTEARVVFDRESGRSRGFGFVTYSSTEEANNAIDSLNGVDLNGRSIRVSMAEARPPRREY